MGRKRSILPHRRLLDEACRCRKSSGLTSLASLTFMQSFKAKTVLTPVDNSTTAALFLVRGTRVP